MITCANCQAENEDIALTCSNCRQPFESITLISKMPGSRSKTGPNHRSHVGKLSRSGVALYIGKTEQPIILTLTSKLILGRHRDVREPDLLDFTPFDGYRLGMSRHHAVLFFKDGTLCIQDTASANGTWVNSTRLQPYDVVALLPGAVISLAQLTTHIYY